jgi:amidase/aspartyl-tRNA(Asn)/glutamyl-tRNA(Gln) amidotransferase subunit A
MDEISREEIKELGEKFDITVTSDEIEWIVDYVNDGLSGLDDVDDLPVNESGDLGARSWSDPTDDPYNAINVECDVPPTDDHSGLLDGLTVGIKDNIMVANVPMSGSSKVMQGFVPSADSVLIDRIRDAGGHITAKTNLMEFAGAPENTDLTPTKISRNPHSKDHWAGGSSGGSATAVGRGTVDVALGTDTGGSVRLPAAYSGIVGLKPTYGLVPLHGVIENTYTQDHVGPMTSTVDETARLLAAIAGKTEYDPSSMQAAALDEYHVGDYIEAVRNPIELEDLTVGVLEEGLEGEPVNDGVEAQTNTAIDQLSDEGAIIEPVSIEHFEYELAVKSIVSRAELADHWRSGGAAYRRGPGQSVNEAYQSSFASRVESVNESLGIGYKTRLLIGAKLISEENGRLYTRAQAARDLIRAEYDAVLEDVDVLLSPSSPIVAPPADEGWVEGDLDYSYNTRGADVTRLPAITLPNGFVDGLPVGLQLIGPAFREDTLLSAAQSVESILETSS